MKIKVHPNSSKEEIKKISDGNFEVWIKEKAEKNKAKTGNFCIHSYFRKKSK